MGRFLDVFLHPAVATLFAFAGVALGVALRKITLHRLSLLVAAAMGTLLAVTLFDSEFASLYCGLNFAYDILHKIPGVVS